MGLDPDRIAIPPPITARETERERKSPHRETPVQWTPPPPERVCDPVREEEQVVEVITATTHASRAEKPVVECPERLRAQRFRLLLRAPPSVDD